MRSVYSDGNIADSEPVYGPVGLLRKSDQDLLVSSQTRTSPPKINMTSVTGMPTRHTSQRKLTGHGTRQLRPAYCIQPLPMLFPITL